MLCILWFRVHKIFFPAKGVEIIHVEPWLNCVLFLLFQAHVGVKVRKYGIFLPLLPPPDCNYPMTVIVLASVKVQDLIGLILYKCTILHPNHKFKLVSVLSIP
jgi:hypothetical protein